jgi:ATP-dependent helicase/nuclease subunit A
MELTPQQHTAIYTRDQNLIVVAGAGSGKTFVLVNRYLHLLDSNPDWPLNALVAITFTKKAAQEMRDRVRQELDRRVQTAVTEADVRLWRDRIAAMESARIGTIHSLCADILRANAAEAGVDPAFDILEEVDARLLVDDVLDSVLAAVARENDPVVALFTEYESHIINTALREYINADIPDNTGNLFEQWTAEWEVYATSLIDRLVRDPAFRAAADWIPDNGWPDVDDKLLDSWQACFDSLVVLVESSNLDARLQALQTLADVTSGKIGNAPNWGGEESITVARGMLKLIKENAKNVLKALGSPPGALDTHAAELIPLWASLIGRVQTTYRAAKDQQSALDFDDLERLTRRLLLNNPSVRARYQNAEFKHLLVDEFQDTNAVQWGIMNALADVNQPGSLFVVGDPKQSVYAFRGADVSVFGDVRAEIMRAAGRDVPLSASFRTHHALVECFNDLFSRILVKDAASPVQNYEVELGEPMVASRQQAPSPAPPLEFLLVNKSVLADNKETDKAEQARRWEAHEIAVRLQTLVDVEKRIIYDKHIRAHRPLQYGDTVLLFQSMTNVTVYEEVFKAAGLPFVTVAGRGYYNRQEVWDLLNLLTALHNPANNLALAAALRSPLFNLSDDALFALRLLKDSSNERLPLWNALDAPEGIPPHELPLVLFVRDCLYELHERAGRVTIAELLREALERTGYLATLTALPDGARRRGNVEKLLEKAQTSGQVTLGAFEQYLRDLTASEIREGEALVDVKDAVTLMTVHASKGLEYPLVVLADSSWSWNHGGTGGAVLLDSHNRLTCKVYEMEEDELKPSFAYRQAEHLQKLRDTAERKRLLYVAATRAQDYLLVTGQITETKDGGWRTAGWLEWLWQALSLGSQPLTDDGSNTLIEDYTWGQIGVTVTGTPPDNVRRLRQMSSAPMWENEAVQAGKPLPGQAVEPLLLGQVHLDRTAAARHLTATQIADLGSLEPYHQARFRRDILRDAPSHIPDVSDQRQMVSGRIIGEIVHKVLGWWRFPSENVNLDSILQSYAWEKGIVDPELRAYAIEQARRLLNGMAESDVFRWIVQAQQLYRELPFVYRTDRRIIHGILDVLLQRPGGSWSVIDYKTSAVSGYRGNGDAGLVIDHARRYHLQVGVYAAAVREQLGGFTPDVYIHYIRYRQTVYVPRQEWEASLSQLENMMGHLLDESEWYL